MHADTQTWIVAGLIALAALYVGRQTWRTWSPRPGSVCGGGCDCAKSGPGDEAPAERLVLSIKQRQTDFSTGKPASHQPR
jgi:hypothetical protein